MLKSTATITTDHASKYLQQMCKHFQHKVEAEWDTETGTVHFPAGPCTMAAEGKTLTINVTAEDEEGLARGRDVIDRHLPNFAFREEIEISWTEAAAA
ncbi:DUF2218 domain-containing protein [Cucumibacter marinus]|uniref:DUF2218 domain-containing protein n=1 Tax=Cucumibacter marinus TaxID=1121252 RepID=UPI0004259DFC|nr:DUF2218 domain-containing protein [Cucumibacter marinus]